MLAALAAEPSDAQSLAVALGESVWWTRYWLDAFRRLKLVREARDGLSRRRTYRLSHTVTVRETDGSVTFRFPEIDRVRMEITVNARTLRMQPASR
jgi:hypothetical protein